MVRTIITPENTHIELDIPSEYVGKKIEVTYIALDEIESERKEPKKTMRDFLGILSKESGDDLQDKVKKSRDEWDRIF